MQAQSTLPVFSLPEFPQVLDSLIGAEIRRVDRILAQTELATCCADRCRERATVEEIATGLEYCRMHFEEVSRG